MSLQLVPPTAIPPSGTVISPPRVMRQHIRRNLSQPRHESPLLASDDVAGMRRTASDDMRGQRRARLDSMHAGTSRVSGCQARDGRDDITLARTVMRTGFARRVRRVPLPPAPSPADEAWSVAKDRLFELNDGPPLSPRSLEASVALCEAALLIAAHPAQYGVHPADAEQAVRLYYTTS